MQTEEIEPKRKKTILPPVQRHPSYYHDPYQNSFLMKFNLKKQKADQLKETM